MSARCEMRSLQDIQFFLLLGYFPDYKEKVKIDLSHIDRNLTSGFSDEDLQKQAERLFLETIEKQFLSGKRHVIPLSGGMDSRALLSALMEFTEISNLETYTFGTPGTCDYEIGNAVAAKAQVRHTPIDLAKVVWKDDELIRIAKMNDCQTFLFHHPPLGILERFKDATIWSGYIGDAVCGGHLRSCPSQSLIEAKKSYIQNRAEVKSLSLINRSSSDFVPLIGGGDLPPTDLSYDEQVLFAEVGKVTAPHVLTGDYNYITPYINTNFCNFMLSLPDEKRKNRRLFLDMCHQKFSFLFDLPSKNYYGLRRDDPSLFKFLIRLRNRFWKIGRKYIRRFDWPALPMTNYFDIDLAIRNDSNFRNLMFIHLQDLKSRSCVDWIDIDTLWYSHTNRNANYGDALAILMSLEINFKAMKQNNISNNIQTAGMI